MIIYEKILAVGWFVRYDKFVWFSWCRYCNFTKNANRDDAKVQFNLGLCYDRDKGVVKI